MGGGCSSFCSSLLLPLSCVVCGLSDDGSSYRSFSWKDWSDASAACIWVREDDDILYVESFRFIFVLE